MGTSGKHGSQIPLADRHPASPRRQRNLSSLSCSSSGSALRKGDARRRMMAVHPYSLFYGADFTQEGSNPKKRRPEEEVYTMACQSIVAGRVFRKKITSRKQQVMVSGDRSSRNNWASEKQSMKICHVASSSSPDSSVSWKCTSSMSESFCSESEYYKRLDDCVCVPL